jgi:hypothetical protein
MIGFYLNHKNMHTYPEGTSIAAEINYMREDLLPGMYLNAEIELITTL